VRLRSPLCMYCLYLARFLRRSDFEDVFERVRGLRSRTDVFTETYGLVAEGDPYRERKLQLNLRVLRLVGMLPTDGLGVDWLLRLSAAANVVDIEVPGYSFEEGVLDRLTRRLRDVVFKAPRSVLRRFEEASRMVFLLDNAGEAVFDVFVGLMMALRGVDVVFVARSLPYEVDVTADEARWLVERVAEELGVPGLAGRRVSVVGTGGRYSGFALGRVSGGVVEALASADVVVSKGIANFEAYLDYREAVEEVLDPSRLVFLLCAKCPVLAELFGVRRGAPVVFSPAACSCSW